MTQQKFKPKLHPVDWLDYIHGFIAMLTMCCGLVLLGIAGLGLLSLVTNKEQAVAGGVLVAMACCLVFPALNVWHLVLDTQGIRFSRLIGWPKSLRWTEITSIRPASRREVLVDGWLWPPFPPREMTAAMTTVGHLRIETRDGRVTFFPPADYSAFIDAVQSLGVPCHPGLILKGGADKEKMLKDGV